MSYSFIRALLLHNLSNILHDCTDPIKQLELKASIEVCEQKVTTGFISRLLIYLKDDVYLTGEDIANLILNLRRYMDFERAVINYDKVEDPAQLKNYLKQHFHPAFFDPHYYNCKVKAN